MLLIHTKECHTGGKDFDLKDIDAKKIYDDYINKNIKWCYSTLEDVKNINSFDPKYIETFKFIKGKVEDTIIRKFFGKFAKKISLLRLILIFMSSQKKN